MFLEVLTTWFPSPVMSLYRGAFLSIVNDLYDKDWIIIGSRFLRPPPYFPQYLKQWSEEIVPRHSKQLSSIPKCVTVHILGLINLGTCPNTYIKSDIFNARTWNISLGNSCLRCLTNCLMKPFLPYTSFLTRVKCLKLHDRHLDVIWQSLWKRRFRSHEGRVTIERIS
jgi:hypothetical protein